MTVPLRDRLNQIVPKITSPHFLSNQGIGNEIGCYIFDYPAEKELEVREHLAVIDRELKNRHPDLKYLHVDLLDVLCTYLEKRNLLAPALDLEAKRGNAAVLKALAGPITGQKIADFIAAEYAPKELDLFLVSGVGGAWPALRAHNLLNCLHPVIGATPLVLFYPGTFDGATLRIFDRVTTNESKPGAKNYYRAFMLIPDHADE